MSRQRAHLLDADDQLEDRDGEESRSAARFDTATYRLVGTTLYDEDDLPDPIDCEDC